MINDDMMSYEELRYIFRVWPVAMINQLYIELWEEGELGYY